MGAILANVTTNGPKGPCLIYSGFKSLEGIGVLAVILEANGFTRLEVGKLDLSHLEKYREDYDDTQGIHGKYVIYTGDEPLEKEPRFAQSLPIQPIDMERSAVFSWELRQQPKGLPCFGFDKSILWNRIGIMSGFNKSLVAARRICSHAGLPEEDRNIHVYYYHMKYNENQVKDLGETLSTDQAIYQIAEIKGDINNTFLQLLKNSAFDCSLNKAHNHVPFTNPIECIRFIPNDTTPLYQLELNADKTDVGKRYLIESTTVTYRIQDVTIDGQKTSYAVQYDGS